MCLDQLSLRTNDLARHFLEYESGLIELFWKWLFV